MSLQVLANQMAAQGRGPDTMLVHMAPSEVAGLQALARAHGTQLTTNPETGLPEAGVLSSILPMVIGAGLTYFSGGALSPMVSAALVGGGTAAATGSWQKGLTAGLGAWGGAGMASGLAGLGEAAGAASAAGANSAVASGLEGAAAEAAQASQLAAPTADAVTSGFTNAKDVILARSANPGFQAAVQQATPGTWESLKAGASRIMDPGGTQEFIKQLGGEKQAMYYGLAALSPLLFSGDNDSGAPADNSQPKRYRYDPNRVADPEADYRGAYTGERKYFDPRFVALAEGGKPPADPKTPVEENPYYTMNGMSGDAFKYLMGQATASPGTPAPAATTPVTGAALAPTAPQVFGDGLGNIAPSIAAQITANNDPDAPIRYSFDPSSGRYTRLTPVYTPPPATEWRLPFDAQTMGGGDGSDGGASAAGGGGVGDAASAGVGGGGFAGGGIAQLAQGGRFLRGPGDGVSDSIPAMIDGNQPAALASDEYVVPARVVAELGNGSSSAGAKRLDEMVARVQARAAKATRGRASVAKDTGARKELPA